jgi:hypothetical protein
VKPSSVEEIKNKSREYMYGTKEETFLWAYETNFNWPGINFDGNHKEQFWKAMIRLKFTWWNEASRRARKKRTKKFQSDLFKDRSEKVLCGSTSFMKTCKIRLKDILQGEYLNNCFTREMTELIFYIVCNGSSIGEHVNQVPQKIRSSAK